MAHAQQPLSYCRPGAAPKPETWCRSYASNGGTKREQRRRDPTSFLANCHCMRCFDLRQEKATAAATAIASSGRRYELGFVDWSLLMRTVQTSAFGTLTPAQPSFLPFDPYSNDGANWHWQSRASSEACSVESNRCQVSESDSFEWDADSDTLSVDAQPSETELDAESDDKALMENASQDDVDRRVLPARRTSCRAQSVPMPTPPPPSRASSWLQRARAAAAARVKPRALRTPLPAWLRGVLCRRKTM